MSGSAETSSTDTEVAASDDLERESTQEELASFESESTLRLEEDEDPEVEVNTQVATYDDESGLDDDPDVLVYRSEHVAGFLDIRPVFHGHVLLVPRVHHETLDMVPPGLAAPLQTAVQTTMRALRSAVGAQGAFVASNNVVSQSVPHLHIHVVPRRKKDGLKGFFWPRTKYKDEEEMKVVQSKIAASLKELAHQK